MNRATLERRRHLRIVKTHSSVLEGIPSEDALILDMSHGGACLWLSDPPPRGKGLALEFRFEGHARALPSKLVWSRTYEADSDRENPSLADSWLAGFAFTEEDASALVANLSHETLRSDDITVSVLAKHHAAGHTQNEAEGEATPGLITFSESSVLGVKAAAKELLPVFANHFTDVHMVFTRDRLKISAPFRTPGELNPPEARRRNYRTIPANQALEPAAPVTIAQPTAVVQSKNAPAMGKRRRVLVVGSSLTVVMLVAAFLGVFHRSGPTQAALKIPVEGQSIPAWAAGLDQSALNCWIELQKKFGLPDATIRSAVEVLRKDDKYSPGQDLYDLARYPAQVKRAFSLLKGVQKGRSFDFGALQNDLGGRVVEGARFPDEPPPEVRIRRWSTKASTTSLCSPPSNFFNVAKTILGSGQFLPRLGRAGRGDIKDFSGKYQRYPNR